MFSGHNDCISHVATLQMIFADPPQANANKPVLCSKAEGILDFTYVTENDAGNTELPKHFLYCSP